MDLNRSTTRQRFHQPEMLNEDYEKLKNLKTELGDVYNKRDLEFKGEQEGKAEGGSNTFTEAMEIEQK